MASGDGLLVRIKPFGGRLPAAALWALAEAAGAHSSGVLELTARGNIQVRGVHQPAAFAQAMVAAGLADADPAREARRNVIAVPPCDDALVAATEVRLADMAGLPAKYAAVVHGAQVWEGAEALAVLHELTRRAPLDGRPPRRPGDAAGHLLHLPFGETSAAALARLAELTPELRTTPWRALLSPVAVPGFGAAGTITACIGAPGCASASTATRADAARLQALGFGGLHISGCAKGCGHPGTATTLVGCGGRYDLVRAGLPTLPGLTLDQVAAAL